MFKYSWLAIATFVLDQAIKFAAIHYLMRAPIEVTPFFNLALAFNTGAAFSFLSNAGGWQNVFFAAIAAVVSVIILVVIRRLGANDKQVAVALWLILGGALGNLFDRLYHGHVVDFVDVYYRAWHWPTFNIADSAIFIGAVLLILDSLGVSFGKRRP
jgi:signal peptidase II